MIGNSVNIQVVSADIPGLLHDLMVRQITVHDLDTPSDLTVRFCINAKDYSAVESLAQKRGDHIKILRSSTISRFFRAIARRPVFLAGMLLLVFLSFFLPTRVLFVRVEGNSTIPSNLILQQAQECGIGFGASRRAVRSEQVKNNLLGAVPQLQWAGVNTYGCTAVISVEEKNAKDESGTSGKVSSIISSADGVITECTVRKGTALCGIGDAVRAGQLLVSGYTDCGLKVQAAAADAEISAQTIHAMDMVTPDCRLQRVDEIGFKRKISLQIGKKLIKFYNGSGISDGTCVKMYSKKYLTLPGGFELPVALITVEYTYFATCDSALDRQTACDLLESYANDYLLRQMTAGQIMQADTVLLHADDRYRLTGEYICTEMIGRTIYEERLYTDGQDHRTNR